MGIERQKWNALVRFHETSANIDRRTTSFRQCDLPVAIAFSRTDHTPSKPASPVPPIAHCSRTWDRRSNNSGCFHVTHKIRVRKQLPNCGVICFGSPRANHTSAWQMQAKDWGGGQSRSLERIVSPLPHTVQDLVAPPMVQMLTAHGNTRPVQPVSPDPSTSGSRTKNQTQTAGQRRCTFARCAPPIEGHLPGCPMGGCDFPGGRGGVDHKHTHMATPRLPIRST